MQHLVVFEAVQQGALEGSAVRNTAVPGTLYGCFLSSDWIRLSIGVSRRRVLVARMRAPLRQVSITTITMAPIKSGTHPPLKTLSRLAPRKVRSIRRNGTMSAAAHQIGHFQYFQITMNASVAVTTMVPVTAMP